MERCAALRVDTLFNFSCYRNKPRRQTHCFVCVYYKVCCILRKKKKKRLDLKIVVMYSTKPNVEGKNNIEKNRDKPSDSQITFEMPLR